ncbi:hypothetical protein NXW27_10845 [Phocaeicola dorei]|nr:hypothetical protein [Phocaeicola dorei]
MAKSLFLYRKNSIFIPDNLSENKKTGNMELIINATLLLTAIVLWIYGQYWRKSAARCYANMQQPTMSGKTGRNRYVKPS